MQRGRLSTTARRLLRAEAPARRTAPPLPAARAATRTAPAQATPLPAASPWTASPAAPWTSWAARRLSPPTHCRCCARWAAPRTMPPPAVSLALHVCCVRGLLPRCAPVVNGKSSLACAAQALQLRRIAAYFDTDAEFWEPRAAWHDLAPHEWDDWFQARGSERRRMGGVAGWLDAQWSVLRVPACACRRKRFAPHGCPCAAWDQPGPPGARRHGAPPPVCAAARGWAGAVQPARRGAEARHARGRGDHLRLPPPLPSLGWAARWPRSWAAACHVQLPALVSSCRR